MKEYTIDRMQVPDVDRATEIWADQYRRYRGGNEAFPEYWGKKTDEVKEFLQCKIGNEAAIVIKHGDQLIGYLAYDQFPFNGENSVFCPAIAHAAIEEFKEESYLSLYRSISQRWVDINIFNHMWTINFNDVELRRILFDLGFGSYGIDGFACVGKQFKRGLCDIRIADDEDANILYELIEESREYYCSAPLFLRRERYSLEDVIKVIHDGHVFIAWDREKAMGFINGSVSQKNNIIELSVKNCGLIDEIGVYMRPEYRGKGLGTALLGAVFDFCRQNNLQGIHVDFETANLFANKFWRKYFDPMLLSVRRTINKNIND